MVLVGISQNLLLLLERNDCVDTEFAESTVMMRKGKMVLVWISQDLRFQIKEKMILSMRNFNELVFHFEKQEPERLPVPCASLLLRLTTKGSSLPSQQ